jgi:DNA-binding NtrC family response regulator/tetratricopeptide (TPR) repeat protein
VVRFAVGLFSALAFLEAEGWPCRPSPGEWSANLDGLPRWSPPPGPPYEVPPALGHARLLHRLLGGKQAREGQPWPRLPKRNGLSGAWDAWMGRAQSRGAEPGACRALLLDLLDLAAPLGERGLLPAAWGVGLAWEAGRAWTNGLQRASVKSEAELRAAVAPPLLGEAEGKPRPLHLGSVPPFPFGGLEPLLSGLLGGVEEARAWLRGRLAGGSESVAEGLAELLRASGGGWILWPSRILDPSSLEALERAARLRSGPLVLLDVDGGESWVQVKRVHLLWLPEVAEGWYLQHLKALTGEESPRLDLLDTLPPGEPRCGASLLPPVPAALPAPASPLLGGGPWKRGGGSLGDGAAPVLLLRKGRLAELLVVCAHNGSGGANLWTGALYAHLGQAGLAQQALDSSGEKTDEGCRWLYRGWVHRHREESRQAAQCAHKALALPLDPFHRVQALLLAAHSEWLAGRRKEAGALFEEALSSAPDADLGAQTRTWMAACALHDGESERAASLLEEARAFLPSAPEPLTSYLLDLWTSVSLKRQGDFDGALAPVERARQCASAHGLRSMEAWCDCEAGDTLRHLYRFEEAGARLSRAADGARALGLRGLLEAARFNQAVCGAEGGDLDGAQRIFESFVADGAASSYPMYRAVDHFWLGLVRFQRGEYPEALDDCERGIAAMGSHRDSEVLLPLLLLRGEILLLTGQLRKLAHLLDQVEGALGRGAETHDRLSALALRRAAAAKGVGAFLPRHTRQAEALLERCDPLSRAAWHLSGGVALEGGEAAKALQAAFLAAKEARSASTACRALWALAQRRALPLVSEEDRRWLADFLSRNRVRGPERGLLPLLMQPREPDKRPEVSPPHDLGLLAAAERGAEESAEAVLRRTGAGAICLVSPGFPVRWWGEASQDQRRAAFAAAGHSGVLAVPGGSLLGCPGEDGLWAGFLRQGKGGFSEEEALLARLWTRLLRVPPEGAEVSPEREEAPALRHLLTRSPVMEGVAQAIRRAAAFDFPVLVTGEAGVGKEACAQALHAASGRARRELVPLNCANLTPTLAASLLFGHRRGAFTGADRDREGLVEAARGSTLFLDEVGELPPEVQAGLLRFLQDGSYLPLGETRPRTSDARIIAATNRDLRAAVREGLFREDLFHRLNVIPIEIPPLRRRPEDIPLLFEHFLGKAAKESRTTPPPVDPRVLTRMAVYRWPGNVRELQNLAKHLLVAAHGEGGIREDHLPERIRRPARDGASPATLAELLREAERSALTAALQESGGNLAAAARRLGVTRQAMHAKMRRLGMARP